MNPEENEPLPRPRPLRHYLLAARITLALDLTYAILLTWVWRGHDQLPSQFAHSAILGILAVCSIVSWTTYFVGRGNLQVEERLRADLVISQAQTEERVLAEVIQLRAEFTKLNDLAKCAPYAQNPPAPVPPVPAAAPATARARRSRRPKARNDGQGGTVVKLPTNGVDPDAIQAARNIRRRLGGEG